MEGLGPLRRLRGYPANLSFGDDMFPDFYLMQIVKGKKVLAQWVTMCTEDIYLEEEVFPGMGTEFRKLRHLTQWLEENQPDCQVVTKEYDFSDLPSK